MATQFDPAVRQLTGEVLRLQGDVQLVDQADARAIRNLNDQANTVEQHAFRILSDLSQVPQRGLVGNPVQSQERLYQVETVADVLGKVNHAKMDIRAYAKAIHTEGTLTYDVRESWAHWGVKNFVGKPIKAVAYDAPAAFVEKTGAINSITITALLGAGAYGYLTGDYQGAAVVAGSGLVGRGVIHLGDRAYHKVMG